MVNFNRRTFFAASAAMMAGSNCPPMLHAAERFDADLGELRQLAGSIQGALPTALNAVNVAASVRPRRFVIQGGDERLVTMPRTAYQVVYPDGSIMLDSGLDEYTHATFSQGRPEPFYAEDFIKLRAALEGAKRIIFTHFHADHVGGVVTAPNFKELAAKTIATPHTLQLMMDTPHRPHLKLSAEDVARFIPLTYGRAVAVAPGLVLFKAPGHSPDMQMVFIRMQSGREFLHSIDAAWITDNIAEVRGKAAPWVIENPEQVNAQLAWLKAFEASTPDVTVLVTHDQSLFDKLRGNGTLGALAV